MKKDIFIRSPHNYDMDIESEITGLLCDEDGLTQQQFKDECDINTIVARFGLTGEMPSDFRTPISGDFTDIPSFEQAMLAIRTAEEEFMRLPGKVRARFANDPQRLIDFVEHEENREEAMKLGLLQQKPEKTRDMVDAVDELKAHFVATQPPKEK